MSDAHPLRANSLALIPRFQQNLINCVATPGVVRRARSRRDGAFDSGAFTIGDFQRSPRSGRRLLRRKASGWCSWRVLDVATRVKFS